MGGEKLPPDTTLLAFERGLQAVCLEHVGDRASCDLVAKIVERASDPRVAPVSVLQGHSDDELTNLVHDLRPAGPAPIAAIVFPRDQVSMPAQERVRRHERFQGPGAPVCLGVLALAARRRRRASVNRRRRGPSCSPEDAILLLEVVDDVHAVAGSSSRRARRRGPGTLGEMPTCGPAYQETLDAPERGHRAKFDVESAQADQVDRIVGQYGREPQTCAINRRATGWPRSLGSSSHWPS